MDELKHCKECIKAKAKTGFKNDIWYCGKHRRYITEHTTSDMYRKDGKQCPDYERR